MDIKSGIDIIEVKRIKRAVDRWNNKFIKRVFTDKEINYSKDKRFYYQHLAARFATKEAVLKAFGEGFNKFINWKDIEVLNQKNGKPEVKLYGYLRDLKEKKKIKNITVSISHTRNYAVANCVLIKEGCIENG